MRIKYSRLAKLFGVVVAFLLVVPYLVKNLDKSQARASFRSGQDYERAKPIEPVAPHEEIRDAAVVESQDRVGVVDNKPKDDLEAEGFDGVFREGVLGNYEPVNLEPRTGPGEYGVPVEVSPQEKAAADASVAEFGFNMIASGKISLDRRIKDTRPAECKYWHYPQDLPTASVVLVFHNEGWSVLMRTVHSVINTSPPHLLKDIILVDDDSNTEELKGNLDNYIKRFNGLVKLVRTTKREGLVQARMIGAEHSEGDVIVILDAHCECVVNWLPPLLARIKLNRKTLAAPIVDGIDWNTLKHDDIYGGTNNRGIFEWGFLYKETSVPQEESVKHKYKSEPYWSPTHAGGLLAIEKKWFFELGGYDPGIKIWGAEQYELSFKVWQCGGVVEWVPCSHVAHAYRGPRTKSVHPAGGHPYQSSINHMRVAEVWMDEYKEYFYIREPNIRKLDLGDISEQVAIRNKLQCKPFKWFMENIAYDLVKKFPLPPANKVWGETSSVKHKVCLDTKSAADGQPIGVSPCHGYQGNQCKNTHHSVCLNTVGAGFGQPIGIYPCKQWPGQLFRLNVEGELSNGEHCYVSDRDIVKKKFCLDYQGVWNPVGEWDYNNDTKQIKSNKEKKCLETDGHSLRLAECRENDQNQQWIWKETYINA